MKMHQNPLFREAFTPHADMKAIESPTVFVDTRKRNPKREIRDLRRAECAADAVKDFGPDVVIHGLTKGQFSLLDILSELTKKAGPCHLDISTWTAAKTDVATVCDWLQRGELTSSRWLVDLTFQRRTPEIATQIRRLFGDDAIRVAQNHVKLSILTNSEWQIVVQTSMNLNFNPRFENFTIQHDPELAKFYTDLFDEIWEHQSRARASDRPYNIHKHFANDL